MSEKQDKHMLEKVIACADWGTTHQQEDGAWVTFDFENPDYPYSAMAQGEGISLLLRAYLETKDKRYTDAADKALRFMLLPFDEGGPTKYEGEHVFFYERPREPLILNGWIFALWGVMDYVKFTNDPTAKKVLDRTIESLEKKLPAFSLPYWSMYDEGKRICSPFYHKLHIAQLRVMFDLTGKPVFNEYADKWQHYQNNWLNRKLAFLRKACQKVFE